MLIVEGPDGSGKTTLVQHLAQKFDLPVAERVVGTDTKPIIPNLQQWVDKNLRRGSQRMIFDRHRLISEPIYSPCMGRSPAGGFDDIFWMTGAMLKFGRIAPFIIYCLPPYEMVQKNLKNDPENIEILEYTHLIYPAYVAKAATDIARGHAMMYDYTADHAEDRVDMMVDRWLKTRKFGKV